MIFLLNLIFKIIIIKKAIKINYLNTYMNNNLYKKDIQIGQLLNNNNFNEYNKY